MGQPQPTGCRTPSASTSRFPLRPCHRKGCPHRFVPHRWNQRYCREPDCLLLLHRWQGAKRQQRRRNRTEVRQQHADAERQRRIRQRAEAHARPTERSAQTSEAPTPRAWSRSKKNLGECCDRPGCFEPRRPSRHVPSRYCGDTCRQASRRVRDRERKWKKRKRQVTSMWQQCEGRAARRARRPVGRNRSMGQGASAASACPSAVRHYRDGSPGALSSRETLQEVSPYDRETSAGRRSRPPPST